MDDEDRLYVSKGLGEFLSIDKAGQGISQKIIENIENLLESIAVRHKLRWCVLNVHDLEFDKRCGDVVGLIDTEMDAEEGHWGAFYYNARRDAFILYDPMHDDRFVPYLETISKRVHLVGLSHHPIARRANGIRPFPRQKYYALGNGKTTTLYPSQHQFCFAECLLFLEELLGDREVVLTKTYKQSLVNVKRYMVELANRLDYRVPNKFASIWMPRKKVVKRITSC